MKLKIMNLKFVLENFLLRTSLHKKPTPFKNPFFGMII